MDKELLSFVIETLLLKPQPLMGTTVTAPGYPDASQSSDSDVVREHAGAMRDLIAERIASNAGVIADTLTELIKCNARMQPDVIFELCDGIVPKYQFVLTNRVTSIDPKLGGALKVILSYCNYSFTPPVYQQPMQQPGKSTYEQFKEAAMMQQQPMRQPVYNQPKDTSAITPWSYNDASMAYASQLQGVTNSLKSSVEGFIQAILSSKGYSPLTELRNCKSKVVIVHDSPYKDKIRDIADEKYMVVLTDTLKMSDPMAGYPNHYRPELELLLLINAYNSPDIDIDILFPKDDHARHLWASITDYLTMEQYINNTEGIRDELARKAPKFLKDFDEDLATLHKANK